MNRNEDLRGHPAAMVWLAENKAAIVAHEEGRRRRERIRVAVAMILVLFGVVVMAISISNLPQ